MGMKLDNQSAFGSEQKKTRGNPGPGSYKPNYNPITRNEGAFSIKAKVAEKTPNKTPGPGAYTDSDSPQRSR